VTTLAELATPALVLERGKLEANGARMRARLEGSGVRLRQHVKTSKSIEVARLAADAAHAPITVSTLAEAEHFFAHGFDDVLYAVGLVPGKFARVLALARAGCRVQVLVDGPEMAAAFVAAARAASVRVPVVIEIDTDDHRAGLAPESKLLLGTAAVLAENGLLGGVLTHAGNSYTSRDAAELRAWSRRERAGVLRAAERLREAGHAVPLVSLGSTPTVLAGESLAGVSEVRVGVYVFFDLVMAGLGVCALEDVALSVLASVIGHQAEKGWLVTDAGWMALSRDRGTQGQALDHGYGRVCDLDGHALEDLVVFDANQEHGLVAARSGPRLDVRRYPVGTLLRILPNHACATAAQHAAYHVVRGGRTVEARWERLRGW
jgi:D-serine deaminase-like pyridoxal phosphate-dependent protein